MKNIQSILWQTGMIAGALLLILFLTLKSYHGNVTALFHIDRSISDEYELPEYTVLLNGLGYDGMEYYQIARNVPLFVQPEEWPRLRSIPPGPYAHQRILLPLLAFILGLGRDVLIPYAFLAINLLSLIGAALVIIESKKKNVLLFAAALVLSPAATVGLHFSLAEPLTIFLLTVFLDRFIKHERIGWIDVLLLIAIVLTREINILFIGGTGLYLLWKKHWKDALLLIIPVLMFVALHGLIYAIFQQIPFLWSAEKNGIPLYAIFELLLGGRGYDRYTLSAILLFLLFVFPAFLIVIRHFVVRKNIEYIPFMLLLFLIVMLLMPDHIWGSITSIGRVITPVYPLFIFFAMKENTMSTRTISAFMLLLGLGAALGLAFSFHPFMLA